MNRYATFQRLGRFPSCEDYARIHNGGPNGYKQSWTNGYWKKSRAKAATDIAEWEHNHFYLKCANYTMASGILNNRVTFISVF